MNALFGWKKELEMKTKMYEEINDKSSQLGAPDVDIENEGKADFPKLRIAKFDLEKYGIGEGMKKPPRPELRDFNSFKLSVENCRMTDIRVLYRVIANHLKFEAEMIEETEREGSGDVHPLQYGVREFLENILAEMKKVEGIDDLGYYLIKTR